MHEDQLHDVEVDKIYAILAMVMDVDYDYLVNANGDANLSIILKEDYKYINDLI